MKTVVLILFIQAFCVVGFCGNLMFTEPNTIHILADTNLDVRWNAETNTLPQKVWIYHLLPREMPEKGIKTLMDACSFTDADRTTNGNVLIFKSNDGNRQLRVFSQWGTIDYQALIQRSWANLVANVPSDEKTLKMTKELLPKLGIKLKDIQKKENSSEPDFQVFHNGVTYYVNHKPITNVESCGVRFKRSVDGISFLSINSGGDGEIQYGGDEKIIRILIAWRNMERKKSYPAFTPEMMMASIRHGRAIQQPLADNVPPIDWRMVKSVTIKKVVPRYYAGGDPFSPSDWLKPYAALLTTVETDNGTVDVEIDCPIIADDN
jgi:hypothetical protein